MFNEKTTVDGKEIDGEGGLLEKATPMFDVLRPYGYRLYEGDPSTWASGAIVVQREARSGQNSRCVLVPQEGSEGSSIKGYFYSTPDFEVQNCIVGLLGSGGIKTSFEKGQHRIGVNGPEILSSVAEVVEQ